MAELELRVDRIGCDGAGLCAELLPEQVSLDEWGYPIVRPGAVPPALLEHASRAVDACPVLALRLAPVRGRTRTAAVLAAPGRAESGGSPVAATPAMATAPRPPDHVTEPTGSPAETPSHDSPHRSRPQA